MQHTPSQPGAGEETEQFEWVPAAPGSNRSRTGGAIVVAVSCLTIGISIGGLWGPGLQKLTIAPARTASDTPQSSRSDSTSEPTLALGGPADTLPSAPKAEPKLRILNEGSATVEVDQRSPEGGLGQTRGAELPAKSGDAGPTASNVTSPRAEPKRRAPLRHEPGREKDLSAKPAERTFKNYNDLRNYALGR
jgi:hypothetical protein